MRALKDAVSSEVWTSFLSELLTGENQQAESAIGEQWKLKGAELQLGSQTYYLVSFEPFSNQNLAEESQGSRSKDFNNPATNYVN